MYVRNLSVQPYESISPKDYLSEFYCPKKGISLNKDIDEEECNLLGLPNCNAVIGDVILNA